MGGQGVAAAGMGARLGGLEGVRGLAALAVVLHHTAGLMCPRVYLPRDVAPAWAVVLGSTPLRFLHDGPFAVRLFFVLSGVVLSLAYFRRPDRTVLADAALRRYVRLTPPILASFLVVYLLLVCGAINTAALGEQMRLPPGALRGCYDFSPRLRDLFREGLVGVLFQSPTALRYNPPFWTMSVEFGGSFLLFAFLALAGHLRRRWAAYVVVGVVLAWRWPLFADFLVGAALCDVFVHARRQGKPLSVGPLPGAALVLAGLAFGTAHPGWLWSQPHPAGPHGSFGKAIGAVLVLAAVLFCPAVRCQLERPVLRWLGAVSFPLYLIHWPVLFALAWMVYPSLRGVGLPHGGAVAGTAVACVAASLLAAWALSVLVDRPAVWLGRAVAGWATAPRSDRPTALAGSTLS